MTPLIDVYIGMGSNLHEPLLQITEAIDELHAHPNFHNVEISKIYQSKPVGPQDQPDYINAAAYFQTYLGAHHVLDELQALEQQHGRLRKRHWGERTLDLDLLLYGNAQIHTPRLTVPHPFMLERSFVLFPLADLSPTIQIPPGHSLQDKIANMPFDLQPIGQEITHR